MSAPARTLRAACPACDETTVHEEFFRERRSAASERAARAGEFRTMQEYTFRCTACGARHDKLLDERGILHKWQGNRHVTMDVG